MSWLVETFVAPVLGNTYKVNTLLTETVLCLSHQVICHTNKGWEICCYIHCFHSDLWCSINIHGTTSVCTSRECDPLAFWANLTLYYVEEMLGGCAAAKNRIIAIEYTLLI